MIDNEEESFELIEKYRVIIENVNDLICIIDQDHPYKIKFINETIFLSLLNYSNEDLVENSILNYIHPEDFKDFEKFLKKGTDGKVVLESKKDELGNTVYRINEWGVVGEWMWANRNDFNGISVLPYDGGSYIQAPFEDCSEDTYNEMMKSLKKVDLSSVLEIEDNTNLAGELACSGGACEIDIDMSSIKVSE